VYELAANDLRTARRVGVASWSEQASGVMMTTSPNSSGVRQFPSIGSAPVPGEAGRAQMETTGIDAQIDRLVRCSRGGREAQSPGVRTPREHIEVAVRIRR